MRGARRRLTILAMALVVAGCASTAPTPQTIYVTLPPGETATPTAEPTAQPMPSPTEEPSPAESPSGSPSGPPASPAAGCTGSEAHKAYFVQAAKDLPWDVYCAVLPSDWWLQEAHYHRADEYLFVLYRNSAGMEAVLVGGRLCDVLSNCLDWYPTIGPASFDGLDGTIRHVEGGYGVIVGPHSIPGYVFGSADLSQAKVAEYAAAVIKVPKP